LAGPRQAAKLGDSPAGPARKTPGLTFIEQKLGDPAVTEQEIETKVIEIVAEQMGVDKGEVTRQTSFVNDLNADSLDTVELVMAFEEEFGCEIPDDAAETILTVGDATKFLEKNAKS
jgi:acyl carrier protein